LTTPTQPRGAYVDRPSSGSLADVVDLILDKGLVIDAYVRVSLVGIELLTIDARIVIAGVDTYLRFAEAAKRLDLGRPDTSGLSDLPSGLPETRAISEAAQDPDEPPVPRQREVVADGTTAGESAQDQASLSGSEERDP
jgi:gas vesicle structural protein